MRPSPLIGAEELETATSVAGLYGVRAPLHITALGVAEMIKHACNCFRGLKVAFANENGNVYKPSAWTAW